MLFDCNIEIRVFYRGYIVRILIGVKSVNDKGIVCQILKDSIE